ncbi:MAG TPA: hypothetical protein VMT29_15325 [Steroidobacteraceae bacterium]|nr:hypothetical protein [Steroidobacteraceae bacterium]
MHIDLDRQSQEVVAGRLRQLPTELEPPYNWQEFRRRSRCGTEAALAPVWAYLAVAAALVAVVAGAIVWTQVERSAPLTAGASTHPGSSNGATSVDPTSVSKRPDDETSPLSTAASGGAIATSGTATATSTTTTTASVDLARARALEMWLASLPPEPAVVRVGTHAAVARLEDRIAQVDDLLTTVRLEGARPDGLVALQAERARLVGSLAQVRFAEYVSDEAP